MDNKMISSIFDDSTRHENMLDTDQLLIIAGASILVIAGGLVLTIKVVQVLI